MMEKAIKQRLLGGVVLVAGAALFLPVLMDGSGAGLTIPPLPAAPEVSSVEAMSPRLDQKVAETEQAVDAAHAGRDAAPADAVAAGEDAGDVAPDAAAVAAGEAPPAAAGTMAAAKPAAVPAVAAPATANGKVPATPAPVAATPAPATATAPAKAAAVPPAKPAPAVAQPAKPLPAPAPAVAAVPAKPASPVPAKPAVAAAPAKATVPAPVPASEPAKPAAKEAAAARAAADKALPGAWLVQVGVFSSRETAQGLVQKLRRKGYAAVLSPQGSTFKVVVGPELNRSVADSIKSRLAADPELKLNGWVQAYKP